MAAQNRVLILGFVVKIFFPFVGLFFAPAVHAQAVLDLPEQLTADVIDTKGLTQKMVGNVRLRYKGVVLFCDQAVHNVSAHSVNAYGHVLVVQGDSITARGDSANFAYSDRHLLLYGRVMFQDHRTTLTTTQLDYDLTAGVVTYNQKGRIVNGKNVLTSLKGTYNLQLKQFTCQQSVQLATSKNTVKSESLVYNTVTQRSSTLPKIIHPAVVEQRTVETKPVQQVAETITPPMNMRRPSADQVATAVTTTSVTKPVATVKPVSNQLSATPESKAKSTLATKRNATVLPTSAANSASAQSGVTFSPAMHTVSNPTFRQAVQAVPATSTTATYTADLSDLERELNKKKRFH